MQGFFAAYSIIPKHKPEDISFKIYFKIIRHRFARTWPAYMMLLLFYIYINKWLYRGPLMHRYDDKIDGCYKNGWRNMLYIDNISFLSFNDYCYGICWFLSVDIQKYMTFPLAIFAYIKKRKYGYVVALLLLTQSLLTLEISSFEYNFEFGLDAQNINYFHYFYWTPWARWFSSYIGIIIGFMYHEYSKKTHKSKWNIFYFLAEKKKWGYAFMIQGYGLIFLCIALPLQLAVNGENYWSTDFKRIWVGLASFIISVGFALCILPMMIGNRHEWLNKFFNLKIFAIAGKLSYSFFLVHLMVIFTVIYTRTEFYEGRTFANYAHMAGYSILWAQIAAFVFYLLVERPLTKLCSLQFSKQKSKQVSNKQKAKVVAIV